ncbi:MAG TPA: glycosyl hydrolase, partial [Opitutus sp.]|nr:glycosyl hydrolase [Opitutus sp.]
MNPRLHSSRTALLRASRLVAVVLAVASSLTAATDAPVSPNAQPGVGALLRFFNNVSGRYIVSGQQEIAWDENRKDEDINYIIQHTGKTPSVRGFDFLKYIESPASRTRQAATQRAIEWWKAGGIVTFCTHFFVDIGSTNGSPHFYTPGANGNPQGTNFDIRQAVIAGTPENSEFMAKLDVMAEELIKLRDAGVPVIWRPFHETGGTWFWWSRHGAAPFIQAWRIMFQRYTQVHGLTNLIWCYNPIDSTTIMQTWYPGDDVVDMISLDVYPPAGTHPTYTADYQRMRDFKGGRKPVVMSENGAIPNVEQMFAEGGGWGYFCTWNGFENNPAHNTVAFLTSVYHHPKVLTLDELAGPYAIYSQPLVLAAQSQSAPPGTALTLTAAPAAGVPANLQWQRNGVALNTASAITLDLALADVQPATAGLYSLTSAAGTSAPAIVGVSTTSKVIGFGEARDQNIVHPNGNTFDQVLLTGVAATITADHALGQITRTSFIDVDHDIVQVEFSGPGTLTLVLDNAGPAASPVNYTQNVSYVKGHAGIVITGATEQTN